MAGRGMAEAGCLVSQPPQPEGLWGSEGGGVVSGVGGGQLPLRIRQAARAFTGEAAWVGQMGAGKRCPGEAGGPTGP